MYRRGKGGTLSLRGTALKRQGPNPISRGALTSFKIAPGSNPLEEMGGIEDIVAEMRTAGLTLDDHMLYTIFIDVLPNTRWRQGTWHLVTASAR